MAATRALLGPSGAEQDRMVGRVLGARYRVLSRLGEGGMGTVYLCEHAVLGRRYAVKVLRPELAQDAELVARFRNEAVAASRIGGENVVDVLDFGVAEDGASYYVMEALEGRSLAAVIGEDGPLAVPRALALLEQLCRALGAAHARGVVHRDVKPDNVFVVTGADGGERAKVIDFGISKVAEEPSARRLTRAGAIIGTPEYMAPEQAAGEPVDHRADVYALGVLAYEVLTGTLPIVANTPVATLVAHQTRTPEAPSARRPGIPREVDAVVLAALAKRPEDRPASMEALAAALAAIRRGAAPAPPPRCSPPARGAPASGEASPGPRSRRRSVRAALVLAGAALLAAAVAVAGGARLARRAGEAAGAGPGAVRPPHAAGSAAPPSAPARAADAAAPARPPPRRAPARPARRAAGGAPAVDRDLQDPYAGGGLKPDPFE
jgi:serine/threonine-protein kinase